MKWLVILLLFLVLAAMIAYRFRRQINFGLEIYRMFRQLRSQSKPQEKRIEKAAEKVPLVRCARCGTWAPQNKALNLRSKTFYCTASCMEEAVEVNK